MSEFDYPKVTAKIFEVINAQRPVDESVAELLRFGESEEPGNAPLWNQLRTFDYAGDAAAIATSFASSLRMLPIPDEYSGFYFGLDGLNMPQAKGLEFGCSKAYDDKADPNSIDWAYECSHYPFEIPSNLLSQLYGFVGIASLADFVVCISYTGLAVREALRQLPLDLTLGGASARAVCFGPHDGDLFLLGTLRSNGFQVQCRAPTTVKLDVESTNLLKDFFKEAGLPLPDHLKDEQGN